MLRVDTAFILIASACLIVGVSMGIAMGIAHDFQFAPVHAHLNLLGWTSLALFGLTYKSYPMLANSRIALAHLMLSSISAVLFPVGIYFSVAHGAPGLAIGTSLVWFLGAVLFFANLVRTFVFAPTLRAPEPRRALA
jgi:hypothetical protein